MTIRLPRRKFINLSALGAAALALPGSVLAEQPPGGQRGTGRPDWKATWFSTQSSTELDTVTGVGNNGAGFPPPATPTFSNQTIRQIVKTSIGGSQIRVRIANTFGTSDLRLGAARIGQRSADAGIVPSTNKIIRFNGSTSVIIPPGAFMVSDPVSLDVPALTEMLVSLYFPQATRGDTRQIFTSQSVYLLNGDQSAIANPSVASTISSTTYFVNAVEVLSDAAGVVVCIGDSLTAGGWPSFLAQRASAPRGSKRDMGVVNAGYGGNRMLHNGWAPNALARFDRDVLGQAGVTDVIVMEGINDIQYPWIGGLASEDVSADQIIGAHRQLIQRAHAAGLNIYGATLTPFRGAASYNAGTEAKRQAINRWMRTSGEYDAVFDFEAVLRDQQNPPALLPQFDIGDHLHFTNNAGNIAVADTIDLKALRRG